MQPRTNARWSLLTALLISGAVLIPLLLDAGADDNTLTLYCAHDSIFADQIIRLFEKRTGIRVSVRYDEEANKSLGLTNLLISEKDHPRCDVFWNNQTLGTIRLTEQGVLTPYRGSGYQRIPAVFRDPDGFWTGFAARLRVYIINTDLLEADEASVARTLQAESLRQVAIAIPLYGTTLSHYAVLAAENGVDGLKEWHQSLHHRGIREARGNGSVKDLVAEGTCRLGFTDTDDAFVALDQGKPVRMLPVRLDSGQTIVIPNSVAMIRNCQHPQAAEKLIDFLLSEEVEILLAESASRQIPLGPTDLSRLSPEVRQLTEWSADGISLKAAAAVHQQVLDWLSSEYLPQ